MMFIKKGVESMVKGNGLKKNAVLSKLVNAYR